MKSWLLLICIGLVGYGAYHERGRWTGGASATDAEAASTASTAENPPGGTGAVNAANPTPPAVNVPVAVKTGSGASANVPPATDRKFDAAVAESQKRAVQAHPNLAVPGSHFNTAFVARFRVLKQQRSPRLNDPTWPEKLADECALQLPAAYK